MGRHVIVENDELYHYGIKGMKWKDHVYNAHKNNPQFNRERAGELNTNKMIKTSFYQAVPQIRPVLDSYGLDASQRSRAYGRGIDAARENVEASKRKKRK